MVDIKKFLEHHGIKGQRWGVRRSKASKAAAAKRSSVDHKAVAGLKNKSTRELSNKQLKKVNERLNLEQNFNKLNPSKVAKGHATAKNILAAVGTVSSIVTVASTPAGKAAIATGKKALQKKP